MPNLNNSIIIGQNVREIRRSLNLTQEEFAEELNINAQFLSQIETGKTGISIDNAINICNIANCSSGKLFNTLVKTPDNIEKYELLTDRDKSIINNMITILLDTKWTFWNITIYKAYILLYFMIHLY